MSELRAAVREYLQAISRVSAVGTPELSHYTALDNLFDAIGEQLSPRVRAVVHYSETSPGQPDLGFFSGENTDLDRHAGLGQCRRLGWTGRSGTF